MTGMAVRLAGGGASVASAAGAQPSRARQQRRRRAAQQQVRPRRRSRSACGLTIATKAPRAAPCAARPAAGQTAPEVPTTSITSQRARRALGRVDRAGRQHLAEPDHARAHEVAALGAARRPAGLRPGRCRRRGRAAGLEPAVAQDVAVQADRVAVAGALVQVVDVLRDHASARRAGAARSRASARCPAFGCGRAHALRGARRTSPTPAPGRRESPPRWPAAPGRSATTARSAHRGRSAMPLSADMPAPVSTQTDAAARGARAASRDRLVRFRHARSRWRSASYRQMPDGHRDVQALHRALHRQAHQLVAGLAR